MPEYSVCCPTQTPSNKSDLHILLQPDLDRVVVFPVPYPLLVQLLLIALYFLDAVRKILQLKAQEDKRKVSPDSVLLLA